MTDQAARVRTWLGVSHGPNEYIDEAAMRWCAAVYALYAGELLR